MKKKLNSNFVQGNKTQLESLSLSVIDMGKKVNLKSSIPVVKVTTHPRSAGCNFVALSFLVNGQYFKDYHKISKSHHSSFFFLLIFKIILFNILCCPNNLYDLPYIVRKPIVHKPLASI